MKTAGDIVEEKNSGLGSVIARAQFTPDRPRVIEDNDATLDGALWERIHAKQLDQLYVQPRLLFTLTYHRFFDALISFDIPGRQRPSPLKRMGSPPDKQDTIVHLD